MILASVYLQLHLYGPIVNKSHQKKEKLLSLASFLYLIAVLILMVMGRFLISPFTSIREEQGLNMEAAKNILKYPHSVTELYDTSVLSK
jgi:hypothetical protein